MPKNTGYMMNHHLVPFQVWDLLNWDLMRLKGLNLDKVVHKRAYRLKDSFMMFEYNKDKEAVIKEKRDYETFRTHTTIGNQTWHIECEITRPA